MEAQLNSNTNELVQLAINIRARKQQLFGRSFSSDPGWDILLLLYAARLGNRRFSLDELSDLYPRSVLARWARLLEEYGLVECHTDHLIPSVLWLRLTQPGALKMFAVFQNP